MRIRIFTGIQIFEGSGSLTKKIQIILPGSQNGKMIRIPDPLSRICSGTTPYFCTFYAAILHSSYIPYDLHLRHWPHTCHVAPPVEIFGSQHLPDFQNANRWHIVNQIFPKSPPLDEILGNFARWR